MESSFLHFFVKFVHHIVISPPTHTLMHPPPVSLGIHPDYISHQPTAPLFFFLLAAHSVNEQKSNKKQLPGMRLVCVFYSPFQQLNFVKHSRGFCERWHVVKCQLSGSFQWAKVLTPNGLKPEKGQYFFALCRDQGPEWVRLLQSRGDWLVYWWSTYASRSINIYNISRLI